MHQQNSQWNFEKWKANRRVRMQWWDTGKWTEKYSEWKLSSDKRKKKQWAYSIQGPLLLPGGCYNPTYSQWNDSYWLGSVFNHAQSIIPVPLVNLDVHHSIKLKGSLLTKKPKSSECIFIYLGMCLTQQKEQQLCKTMPWGRLNSSTQNSAAPVDDLCIGITDTAQNVISSKFSLENKLLQIGWKILLK